MEPKTICPKCQSKNTYYESGNYACMMCGKRWPMEGTTPIVVRISRKTTKNCGYCGKEFQTFLYAGHKHNFCSKSCSNKSRGYVQQKECPICGNNFFPKPQSKKYCSRECYGLSRRTPESEKQIYVPVPPKIKQCGVCGKDFIAKTRAIFCPECREGERLRKARATWKTEAYKEAHRRHAREWQRTNSEKYKASTLVRTHPALISVLYECPCGATGKHHHHADYSKPYEVLLLCDKCHAAEHKRLRSLLSAQTVTIAG